MSDKKCRVVVKDKALFNDETLKTAIISVPKGIECVVGTLKSDKTGDIRIQSVIFSDGNHETAKSWIKENIKQLESISHGIKYNGQYIGWLLDENHHIDLSKSEEYSMNPLSKAFSFELKNFDEEKRSFTAIASTESKDRDGDIMRVRGAQLKNFRKNPVLLFAHNDSELPIGKAENIRIEGESLVFDPVFAPAEANPKAEQVFQLFKGGFLKAFSIRFDPIDFEELPVEQSSKAPFPRMGRLFKKWELLEISAVNIPANPEALKNKNYRDFVIKSFAAENRLALPDEIKSDEEEKETFKCECIKCGYTMESQSHCKDLKCPECGGQMRRAERPGPGQEAASPKWTEHPDDDEYLKDLKHKKGVLDALKESKRIREETREIEREIAELEAEFADEDRKEKILSDVERIMQDIKAGITGIDKKAEA